MLLAYLDGREWKPVRRFSGGTVLVAVAGVQLAIATLSVIAASLKRLRPIAAAGRLYGSKRLFDVVLRIASPAPLQPESRRLSSARVRWSAASTRWVLSLIHISE